MNPSKLQDLETAYQTIIQVCLYDMPIQTLEEYLSDNVLLYGTGMDEISRTKKDFCNLIQRQRDQAYGLKTEFTIKPALRNTSILEDSAIYIDEICGQIQVEGVKHVMSMRVSSHFEYHQNKWLLIHLHASLPSDKQAEGEAWPIEEWRTRNAELEKMVAEKTIDLEQKNNELKIEAALEKVRSRSLAMHESDELKDVITVVLEKLQELDILMEARSTGIIIFKEGSKDFIQWVASPELASVAGYKTSNFDHPILSDLWDAKESGKDFFTRDYSFEEKNTLFKYLFEHTDHSQLPDAEKNWILESKNYALSFALAKNSAIFIANFSEILLSETENNLLKRFARVFEQAYTRFLDLQKAEAQAKEAQIEASLERVRATAMTMHTSEDVGASTAVLFNELRKLSIETLRCGIVIIDDSQTMEVWTAISVKDGQAMKIIGKLEMKTHPLLQQLYTAWKQKESFFEYFLAGKDKDAYYQLLSTAPNYSMPAPEQRIPDHYSSAFLFPEGGLYTFVLQPFSEEAKGILKKFTTVFSLTYRRYLDLKQAEEQARKAVREASLDRIRAEIASMRSADDLQRITPLMWRELNTLNVPFVRCGVFIFNEIVNNIQLYLSAPDGRHLGVLNLPVDDSELTRNVFNHWHTATVYKSHWNKEQFINWMQSMIDKGQIRNREAYQGEAKPPESLDLYFVPFSQGMLYVANTSPLTEDEILLIKSLSESFAIAYARYEDFKQLEDAKNRVEATLNELKSTQTQLIQSEKMASLGELTAGIAHEIQNPLNFVNNFAEVNTELIEEMKQEMDKGNLAGAKAISDEIKENEQKINHHGKRADAIVKGMLQHSRKSTGAKEPTDINALVDEYLRLAYHGLRAKDKSFNANMKTDLDETIGNINIISQDIGRVILNLITNAFYAVDEKKKQQPDGYEPLVSVSTKKVGEKIEIRVKDNGNGIPQKVLDKIYQPFFTTKPAGQGTGLGLSLSYDIIKANGGEIKVETKEGEGAEFIISLPIKING